MNFPTLRAKRVMGPCSLLPRRLGCCSGESGSSSDQSFRLCCFGRSLSSRCVMAKGRFRLGCLGWQAPNTSDQCPSTVAPTCCWGRRATQGRGTQVELLRACSNLYCSRTASCVQTCIIRQGMPRLSWQLNLVYNSSHYQNSFQVLACLDLILPHMDGMECGHLRCMTERQLSQQFGCDKVHAYYKSASHF